MKTCVHCGNAVGDDAQFCPYCGASPDLQGAPNAYAQPGYAVFPYDHTAEFTQKDISENKVICMIIYLLGVAGVIIGLLASASSPYVAFHVRQALKFTVVEILSGILALVLLVTVIVPILAAILMAVLFVVRIICFVQICMGKAVEPVILRSLAFLK